MFLSEVYAVDRAGRLEYLRNLRKSVQTQAQNSKVMGPGKDTRVKFKSDMEHFFQPALVTVALLFSENFCNVKVIVSGLFGRDLSPEQKQKCSDCIKKGFRGYVYSKTIDCPQKCILEYTARPKK